MDSPRIDERCWAAGEGKDKRRTLRRDKRRQRPGMGFYAYRLFFRQQIRVL